jgi:hypothetical protein
LSLAARDIGPEDTMKTALLALIAATALAGCEPYYDYYYGYPYHGDGYYRPYYGSGYYGGYYRPYYRGYYAPYYNYPPPPPPPGVVMPSPYYPQ